VSVELAFYIALPVILLVANGRIWRTLVLLCIALAVAQMRARHEMLAHDWDFLAFCHPFEQMPVFLCGVLAALCATRYRMPRIPGGALLLLAIGIVVLPLQHVPDWIFLNHLAFAFLAAASVVLAASHPPIILASRLLRRIGEVSYSMYLIHFGLLGISLRMAEWVVPALDWRTASLQFAITTTATFGLANITYKVIELPAIHWATKYKTRRPSPAMASPVA
jgi:peptidoglycan/LPS O-acetylase OafA/YrhL